MSSRSAKEFEEFARGGTGRQARASGEIDQPGGMDASGDDDEPMRRAVAGVPRIRGSLPPAAGGINHGEKGVLESMQAMSLLTIMEIVGPVLLLAVLIYGTLQWSRRRRGPTQAVREESTRELYREGARAEKREEAGKASAQEKPTSQPPRQR